MARTEWPVFVWFALILTAVSCSAPTSLTSPEPASQPLTPPSRMPVKVIATVDGVPITQPEFESALWRTRGRGPASPVAEAAVLDELIVERATLAAARRAGITVPAEAIDTALLAMRRGQSSEQWATSLLANRLTEDTLRERIHDRLVADGLLRREVAEKATVTNAEIESRFKALPKRHLPERVRASQIVVRTEEVAARLKAELAQKDGKQKFSALAKAHSLGPERHRGGALGLLERGTGPKIFDAIFSQKIGRVSPVLASDYGFHLFLVDEILPAREAKLEDLRESLASELRLEKLRAREAAWRQSLLASVKINRNVHTLEGRR